MPKKFEQNYEDSLQTIESIAKLYDEAPVAIHAATIIALAVINAALTISNAITEREDGS
jgi:hypothetical protein